MRKAFGKSPLHSLRLTWGWLARPLCDFVILKRLIYRRENPSEWKIIEKNVDAMDSLRESGESFIIVVGHFAKQSGLSMLSPDITPGDIVQVANAVKRIRNLYDLRVRIQYGALLKAFPYCRKSCEVVFNNKLSVARTLCRRLQRGNKVIIPIDGGWDKKATGSYDRAFAGHKIRTFSTGALQLAKMAHCPIICCIPTFESDGTIMLEWGFPIQNINDGKTNDINAMNQLFEMLEIAIGERPTEYILGIGGDRRWNSERKQWET
jgi:lauroyl/myristoyl acyltransferase